MRRKTSGRWRSGSAGDAEPSRHTQGGAASLAGCRPEGEVVVPDSAPPHGRLAGGRTAPGHTDPGHTDPGHTDPDRTDPDRTDPERTVPDHALPGRPVEEA